MPRAVRLLALGLASPAALAASRAGGGDSAHALQQHASSSSMVRVVFHGDLHVASTVISRLFCDADPNCLYYFEPDSTSLNLGPGALYDLLAGNASAWGGFHGLATGDAAWDYDPGKLIQSHSSSSFRNQRCDSAPCESACDSFRVRTLKTILQCGKLDQMVDAFASQPDGATNVIVVLRRDARGTIGSWIKTDADNSSMMTLDRVKERAKIICGKWHADTKAAQTFYAKTREAEGGNRQLPTLIVVNTEYFIGDDGLYTREVEIVDQLRQASGLDALTALPGLRNLSLCRDEAAAFCDDFDRVDLSEVVHPNGGHRHGMARAATALSGDFSYLDDLVPGAEAAIVDECSSFLYADQSWAISVGHEGMTTERVALPPHRHRHPLPS